MTKRLYQMPIGALGSAFVGGQRCSMRCVLVPELTQHYGLFKQMTQKKHQHQQGAQMSMSCKKEVIMRAERAIRTTAPKNQGQLQGTTRHNTNNNNDNNIINDNEDNAKNNNSFVNKRQDSTNNDNNTIVKEKEDDNNNSISNVNNNGDKGDDSDSIFKKEKKGENKKPIFYIGDTPICCTEEKERIDSNINKDNDVTVDMDANKNATLDHDAGISNVNSQEDIEDFTVSNNVFTPDKKEEN
eukprot:15364602-Ditylum_brightwellii.AAC.1